MCKGWVNLDHFNGETRKEKKRYFYCTKNPLFICNFNYADLMILNTVVTLEDQKFVSFYIQISI